MCIETIANKTQMQLKAISSQLNIVDDSNYVCRNVFNWYQQEFDAYQEQQSREAEVDRNKVRAYRAKENTIKDLHDEDALKQFYEQYGDVPQWREYKPGKNQLVCLISDLKTAIPTSVMFSVPNIDQFSSRYGLCQK